jgi:predicted CopG family antitoxin
MRTTVELSDPVYRRLKATAVNRGLRGFSLIVEEALGEYFESGQQRRDLIDAIAAAEGVWGDEDVIDFERSRERAWATWESLPSSTQTS